MAEDTTESNNPGEPKKTPTRKRTTAAGLVLSGMTTMLGVAAQAAARAESVQKMLDSLMPFEQPTPNGMDLLVGIPAYRKLEAIEAEAAAKVDPAPPASDRGPGEHRKQDPQSVPAKADTSSAVDQVKGKPSKRPTDPADARLRYITRARDREIVALWNSGKEVKDIMKTFKEFKTARAIHTLLSKYRVANRTAVRSARDDIM